MARVTLEIASGQLEMHHFFLHVDGKPKGAFVQAIRSHQPAVVRETCTALGIFHDHRPPSHCMEWRRVNSILFSRNNAGLHERIIWTKAPFDFPSKWENIGGLETTLVGIYVATS